MHGERHKNVERSVFPTQARHFSGCPSPRVTGVAHRAQSRHMPAVHWYLVTDIIVITLAYNIGSLQEASCCIFCYE